MASPDDRSARPAPTSEPWTIVRVLAWATDDFRERGVESPRLEAEVLLAHVLKVDRIRLILEALRPLDAAELAGYRAAIVRRRQGEPTAYILGQREFYGLDFKVDPRVLIPRPDTELLVDVALAATQARHLQGRALDLCTGTGCVAIAFAKRRPTWQVTATDLSPDALSVARDNALRLGAVWGVRFALGDLFGALDPQERFELITANPPYIERDEIQTLQREVRDHEPHLALDGGPDGLSLLPPLLEGAWHHLEPGGTLAVEIGAGQAPRVADLFTARGFVHVARHKDLAGHERVVSGQTPPAP